MDMVLRFNRPSTLKLCNYTAIPMRRWRPRNLFRSLISSSWYQAELKQLLCSFCNTGQDTTNRPLTPENVCLGVGSDESIDVIIRAFYTPGKDKILICPPTYSAYEVSAAVNDVGIVYVNLDVENGFALNPTAIKEVLSNNPLIKVVFVCSPGNPAANIVPGSDTVQVLNHPTWNGVVVADEAYIDFASSASMAREVNQWPNLIVLHTLSKAFGLAGIRLGVAFSQPQISRLLNNTKGPYNMSAPTVALATAALRPEGRALMLENRAKLIKQRDRMRQELSVIPGFGKFLGGFNANFLLAQFLNKPASQEGIADNATALALQHALVTKSKVLVRFCGNEPGCVGCLRITVCTKVQVDNLVPLIRKTLDEIYHTRFSRV